MAPTAHIMARSAFTVHDKTEGFSKRRICTEIGRGVARSPLDDDSSLFLWQSCMRAVAATSLSFFFLTVLSVASFLLLCSPHYTIAVVCMRACALRLELYGVLCELILCVPFLLLVLLFGIISVWRACTHTHTHTHRERDRQTKTHPLTWRNPLCRHCFPRLPSLSLCAQLGTLRVYVGICVCVCTCLCVCSSVSEKRVRPIPFLQFPSSLVVHVPPRRVRSPALSACMFSSVVACCPLLFFAIFFFRCFSRSVSCCATLCACVRFFCVCVWPSELLRATQRPFRATLPPPSAPNSFHCV